MSEEIPIWVNGIIQWVSGVDRKTTCKDVIEAVLLNEGNDRHNVKDYTIMERWRRVERPLDENSKILKIWSHWGDEKKEVRLCLKRINNEIDSGRGSPVGHGNTLSLKRRRHHRSRGNGKPPWTHQDTLHPKRLAELCELDDEEYEDSRKRQLDSFGSKCDNGSDRDCAIYDKVYGRKPDENASLRKKPGHRSYQCAGTGVLHSTLLSPDEDDYSKPTTSKCCSKRQSKSKIRNSENIEKLMKLILAQGATIQSQLQKLKEREEQIESIEDERHRERIEKNGRNYLLETYLGSLNEAEIPAIDEGNEGESGEIMSKGERLQAPSRISKRAERSKQIDSTPARTHNKTLPSRSKRSRSESRSVEHRCEDLEIKRTFSDNDLAENAQDDKMLEEEDSNTVELQRIQRQMEMWEQVFKINKKLEKEEENLVRLHIKIKRFQMENVKYAKDEEESPEDGTIRQDRYGVQKDLETVRKDLDRNSKEIYQNFTKLKENDDVVQQKRTLLNRLIDDLHETEQQHNLLSQMVIVDDKDEGRTSFLEEDNPKVSQEIVPTPPEENATTSADPNTDYNQRAENPFRQEESVKPKIVKISFDDQIERTERGRSSRTIKGILKNRNCCPGERCDVNISAGDGNVRSQYNERCSLPGVPADGYPLMSYPICNSPVYLETHNYFLQNQESHTTKNIYSGERENNPHGGIMNTKTNIHNDTDSNTSSDTSGMCSMYSSSPTAEEPYTEPTYVLDTLV